jgi:hypothetical protein
MWRCGEGLKVFMAIVFIETRTAMDDRGLAAGLHTGPLSFGSLLPVTVSKGSSISAEVNIGC